MATYFIMLFTVENLCPEIASTCLGSVSCQVGHIPQFHLVTTTMLVDILQAELQTEDVPVGQHILYRDGISKWPVTMG